MINSVVRQREDLQFLNGTNVECSGRIKELKKHPKRSDLDSLLLVNLIVTPVPVGESIAVDHLWILKKQFKKIGRVPNQNERVKFLGKVYPYIRLGGKSIDRCLYGTKDFGVIPTNYLP